MKIYIAIWEDRHADTDAIPFSTPEKAIEFARANARKFDRHGDYKETPVQGWLFCVSYSCEGAGIHVIEKELDSGL